MSGRKQPTHVHTILIEHTDCGVTVRKQEVKRVILGVNKGIDSMGRRHATSVQPSQTSLQNEHPYVLLHMF